MTRGMLLPLLPLLIPAAAAVLALLSIAVRRHHGVCAGLALLGLGSGLVAIPFTANGAPHQVTPLLVFDGYARLFLGLLLGTALLVTVLAYDYFARRDGRQEELYVLLLVATVGSGVLVASTHFASLFLGLEVLSVSLYTLLAYRRADPRGLEAGIKYLVLAASSSAFLLFGTALLYDFTGTMELGPLTQTLQATRLDLEPLVGLALVVVGVGFKLAFVPFHLWTPDVYEGAPAPVTAFIATVSKGGMFALLLRYFMKVEAPGFRVVFLAIAVATMLLGNLLALRQTNLKRLLAYSSIAHFGYLLVAFLAAGRSASSAVAFYLVAYFAMTLAAFGAIGAVSGPERDAEELSSYRGLAFDRPWLAGVLSVTMFSLAGIPLTAGFVGKFYVLTAGVGADLWLALLVLAAGSALGLYYYLRVVVALFSRREAGATALSTLPQARATAVVLAVLLVALLWLGTYPEPLLGLIRDTAGRLT